MKKWYVITGVLAVLVLLAGVFVSGAFARGPNESPRSGLAVDTANPGRGSGQARGQATGGYGRGNAQSPVTEREQAWVSEAPTGELSETEIEGLLYMREEEKLARDVYLRLYQEWGLPIFQNIADSEATHMEAVKTLIDRYDLQDPAADTTVGAFVDQKLQRLYDELVAQGTASLSDALRVGAAIEEIDILDLAAYVAETDKADLQQVYANLTRGSENHLRAFVSTLERQTGESYEPQYLDSEAYDGILAGQAGRGRGRGRGG